MCCGSPVIPGKCGMCFDVNCNETQLPPCNNIIIGDNYGMPMNNNENEYACDECNIVWCNIHNNHRDNDTQSDSEKYFRHCQFCTRNFCKKCRCFCELL